MSYVRIVGPSLAVATGAQNYNAVPIFPGRYHPRLNIRNLSASTGPAYLSDISGARPLTSVQLDKGSSINWPRGRPLWITAEVGATVEVQYFSIPDVPNI